MMSRPDNRPLPFLLALMLLATMIAPAVADTPPPPKPLSPAELLIERLRVDAPGAKLEAGFKRVYGDLWQGAGLYLSWTGHPPGNLEDVQSAGLWPFTVMSATGQPLAVVAQIEGAEPEADRLYVRLREKEGQLLTLGADGDPLAPLISSFSYSKRLPPNAIPLLDWQDILLTHLWRSIQEQLSTYLQVKGTLPADWRRVQALMPLAPLNHQVLPVGATPDVGLQVAIDEALTTIRVTRFPDIGYGTVRYFQADATHKLSRDIAPESTGRTYRDLYVAELLPITTPVLTIKATAVDSTRLDALYAGLVAQDLREALQTWPGFGNSPESDFPLAFTFLPLSDNGTPYLVSVESPERITYKPEPYSIQIGSLGPGRWSVWINQQQNGRGDVMALQKPNMPHPLSFPSYMLHDEHLAGAQIPETRATTRQPEVADWRVLANLNTSQTRESARQRATALRCAMLVYLAEATYGTPLTDWEDFLKDQRLTPASYKPLSTAGDLPAIVRCFEIAKVESAPILRVTFGIPGIGFGSTYLASSGSPKEMEYVWWTLFPEDYPHLTQLAWTPIVRGEILPLPDPPVLPEETTP